MTLAFYTELRNEIGLEIDSTNNKLQEFAKNSAGMVEITPEFLVAKSKYQIAFDKLRVLNGATSNKVKREYSRATRGSWRN